jgi:hypothetical protein
VRGGKQTAARRPEGKPGHRAAPKSKRAREDQELKRWQRRRAKGKAESPPPSNG